MKKDHRDYILTHMGKKTPQQIAKTLRMKERTVIRFIEERKEKLKEVEEKQEQKERSRTKMSWPLLILVALIGFGVYYNSLPGEFIWDDNILVRNNTEIRSWSNLKKVIFGNLGGENLYYKHSSFRPVQTITYMIDYSIGKMNPYGYRMSNVIFHCLVGVSLFWLTFILFNRNLLAFIVAALYIVHPIHTEAVAYVSGRADPLSAIFMLCTIALYLLLLRKERWYLYILMILSYALGILSRENALMAPAFILVYHFAFRKKFQWKAFSAMGIMAVGYIILRVTETVGGMGLKEPVKTSVIERLPGFFVALTKYTKMFFWPSELHMEYGRPMFPWSDPMALIGLCIFLLLIGSAFYFRKHKPIVCFGLLWFFVGLFPVSNTFIVVNAYMGEHWLYFPVMGIFMMIGIGLLKLMELKPKLQVPIYIFLALWFSFLSVQTHQQNKTWLNQIEFYERTREFAPNSGRLHADLGEAYYRVGRKVDSLNSTLRAIEIRPNYYAAYSNLGTIYVSLGQIDNAIEAYKNSLRIKPNYFNALFNLGNIYKDQGKYKEAIQVYNQAIYYKPSLSNAYNNIAICYSRLGEKEKAIEAYEKGIAVDPTNGKFYNNLASAYSDIGKHKKAIELYSKALETNTIDRTNQAIIHYNLALAYARTGDQNRAQTSFMTANTIPLPAKMYAQLAQIYERTGLKDQAKLLMKKAQTGAK